MHILLEKYKLKLSHLPLPPIEIQKILRDFESQVLLELLDMFYHQLSGDEQSLLTSAKTDEDLAERYFSLILKRLDFPDFIQLLDEKYIKILTKAVNDLPDVSV